MEQNWMWSGVQIIRVWEISTLKRLVGAWSMHKQRDKSESPNVFKSLTKIQNCMRSA